MSTHPSHSNATKLVEVDLSVNLMRTLPGGLLDTPSIKRLNLADNYLDPASLDFTKVGVSACAVCYFWI